MADWMAVCLLLGVLYGLVLLHRISSQVEAVNDKLVELLTHEGVEGYTSDFDSD